MSKPERIVELTKSLYEAANAKIRAIKSVNGTTRILSLNAMIEASRAGEAGKGFAVVAKEVKSVSDHINDITRSMEHELSGTLNDLMAVGQSMVEHVRGARLVDLSLNMIEIIDRNLYERSCDVRWWATDSAVVECLTAGTPEAARYASGRLSVILESYTVYLDLWIVDANGRVVAAGRGNRYSRAVGSDVSRESWFQEAMRTADGNSYAVADVIANPQLDGALTATYATAIREDGKVNGRPLGVLGVFFDWRPQAQAVVKGVRLSQDEWQYSRCLLLDNKMRVIAASDETGILAETVPVDAVQGTMGSYVDPAGQVIGYAKTPGYETYGGLGWYGVITQAPQTAA